MPWKGSALEINPGIEALLEALGDDAPDVARKLKSNPGFAKLVAEFMITHPSYETREAEPEEDEMM